MDPAIMTTDELRREIVNTHNFRDIDGLNRRQLSEILRQLRAGHQNPVAPVILQQNMDPAEMQINDIIDELCNLYEQNRHTLMQLDDDILVALLESFRLYGYNPILLRHAIDGNMVAFDEHLNNMRNQPRQGGRKRKSKQRIFKNRRSNRK
jgi:hypothetical protein